MTRGGRLVKGLAISDGLMEGLTGGTDIPDVLIGVLVEGRLDVMLDVLSLALVKNNYFDSKDSHRRRHLIT